MTRTAVLSFSLLAFGLGAPFLETPALCGYVVPGREPPPGDGEAQEGAFEVILLDRDTPAHGAHFIKSRLESLDDAPTAFFGSPQQWAGKDPLDALAFIRDVEHNGGFVLAVDFGMGTPVEGLKGLLLFERSQGEKIQHKGHISHVYVPKEVRGRGVGRALMEKALAWAPKGVDNIYLEVNESNTKAFQLYHSLGFQILGRDPWASVVNGHSQTFLTMGLALKTPPFHQP